MFLTGIKNNALPLTHLKNFEIMKYLKHAENISMNNRHLCFRHVDLTNVDILTYLTQVRLF